MKGRIQSLYFCGFGDTFAKKLDLDVTEGGVNSDGHCAGEEQALLFQFRGNLCRISESLVNR